MRGLCRARSIYARSTAFAILRTVTVVTVLGVAAATACATDSTANGIASEGKATDQPTVSEHEMPRTFAQPAFRPDFRAMTATIEAEPAPQVTASPGTGSLVQVPAAAPRSGAPVLRVTQPAEAVPVAPPASTSRPRLRLEPSWPRTVPEAKAEAEAGSRTHGDPADAYTTQEIATAKAHCAAVLRGVDVVAVPEEPIRQGNCGTPAPMQLISIGRGAQQVTLNPPAVVTCDMVVAMAQWVKTDLQPSARRHLGSHLVRIETMSSYSCRNAYGRKRANLSEHGRANAVDIRSFVTAAQAESDVLAHWGPTVREVKAQVAAAAKAAADKAAQEQAVAAARMPSRGLGNGGTATAPGNDGQGVVGAVGTMIGSVPDLAARLPGAKAGTALGLTQPSRLGGPKESDKPAGAQGGGPAPKSASAPPSAQPNTIGRTQFLRDAHVSACRIFGTVLGPEANNEHKNHFHVDMAERASGGHFCE
jgi:hypothetical protein